MPGTSDLMIAEWRLSTALAQAGRRIMRYRAEHPEVMDFCEPTPYRRDGSFGAIILGTGTYTNQPHYQVWLVSKVLRTYVYVYETRIVTPPGGISSKGWLTHGTGTIKAAITTEHLTQRSRLDGLLDSFDASSADFTSASIEAVAMSLNDFYTARDIVARLEAQQAAHAARVPVPS